jgi:hypothetical protein
VIKIKNLLEIDRQKSYSLLFNTLGEQVTWFTMVQKDPVYEAMINEIRNEADKLFNEPLKEMGYDLFKLFEETGSRVAYEKVYFAKRRRLNTFALMSLLEPKNQSYRDKLHQTIWSICNEYTWCLPAHLKGSPEMAINEYYSLDRQSRQYTIDLFSAETAFSLSEILQLTRDFLDPFLCKRITEEIYERIFSPYENQSPFHWETATHNWASVCAGSIGSAALHLIDDVAELAKILERVLRSMDCYLEGFNDDGTCLEGYGYWQYGFGYYVYFADLLNKKTAGQLDLFDHEKVHQIALFQQKIFLSRNVVANFSDAPETAPIFLGVSHYLSHLYSDFEIPEADLRAHYTEDHTSRWVPAFRNLYWFDHQKSGVPWGEDTYFLKESQWIISRYHLKNANYGFATKGGHNQEPHNHNDIGHFILQKDGETYLKDLGSGLYHDAYFGKERYSFLCNGSQGHSVPIINNQFQREGNSYRASINDVILEREKVDISIDMTNAYAVKSLDQLTRQFIWMKTTRPTLILVDTYKFIENPISITERLIVPNLSVEKDDQGITIQGNSRLQLMFNQDQLVLQINTFEFKNHFGHIEKIKALDFTVKEPKKHCQLKFVFQFV